MQSEPHESLLDMLSDVTARVRIALCDEDIEALERLAIEHRTVMSELNQAGPGTNADLIDLVQKVSNEVREVTEEIARHRDKTGEEIVASGKQKKMVYAYARSA